MKNNCDLLIKNAKVIDGSGSAAFNGAVAATGDTIVAVGSAAEGYEAKKTIDAAGRYVTPGFVDIHTHVDCGFGYLKDGVLTDRYVENMLRQGTTTAIGGNCGMSGINIGEYLYKVDQGGTGPNVGLLAGHGVIRNAAMGMDARKPAAAEYKKMEDILRREMEAGAFGLSSGLAYAPGCYSDVDEIAGLCSVVKEYEGIYTSHVRNADRHVRDAWREIIEVGRRSGARVHISHFLVNGREFWGAAPELISMLNAALEEGITISGDTFPYVGSGWTLVGGMIPNWVQAGGTRQGMENIPMKARLKDPALLPRIREEIKDSIGIRGGPEGILFLNSTDLPEIRNKFLSQVAEEWGMEPVDAVIKIAIETTVVDCNGFQVSWDDNKAFFEWPRCSVASDTFSTLVSYITNTTAHPRNYGNFPRFIQHYVKENKTFTIEEAVRKMTSLPASTVKIPDRGLLREGMKADILIIDLDKVADNSTYTDSNHYPSGIDTVIVNGKAVILEGIHQRILSGVALHYMNRF